MKVEDDARKQLGTNVTEGDNTEPNQSKQGNEEHANRAITQYMRKNQVFIQV